MLFCKLVGVILRMQSDGNSNFRLSCSFERFGIEIVRCKGLGGALSVNLNSVMVSLAESILAMRDDPCRWAP